MQETKQKKKRKLLTMTYEEVNGDKLITSDEVRKKLLKIFRNHIGRENSLSALELFEKVYGIHPSALSSVYMGLYMFERIKREIRNIKQLRMAAIISLRNKRFYILQSNDELMKEEKKMDTHISNINKQKDFFREWVANAKWKDYMHSE